MPRLSGRHDISTRFDWVLHLTTVLTEYIRHDINSLNITAPCREDTPGLRGALVTRTASGRGLEGGSWFFIQLHDFKNTHTHIIHTHTGINGVENRQEKNWANRERHRACCRWGVLETCVKPGALTARFKERGKGYGLKSGLCFIFWRLISHRPPPTPFWTSVASFCSAVCGCFGSDLQPGSLLWRGTIFATKYSAPKVTSFNSQIQIWVQSPSVWTNAMVMWQRSELCNQRPCSCVFSNLNGFFFFLLWKIDVYSNKDESKLRLNESQKCNRQDY